MAAAAPCVERLRCFRGIDDLTALTIAAELGDARRFPSASRVMAFTGNAPLRRVLVESAWHYRHHPFLGDALRHRQRGAPPAVIEHAWRAQHRRYRRTGQGQATHRLCLGRE